MKKALLLTAFIVPMLYNPAHAVCDLGKIEARLRYAQELEKEYKHFSTANTGYSTAKSDFVDAVGTRKDLSDKANSQTNLQEAKESFKTENAEIVELRNMLDMNISAKSLTKANELSQTVTGLRKEFRQCQDELNGNASTRGAVYDLSEDVGTARAQAAK